MAEDLAQGAADHLGLVTVFGGTGFLGYRIIRHLFDYRFQVRTASRHPEWVKFGIPTGRVPGDGEG